MTQIQRKIAIFALKYERKHPEKKLVDITYGEILHEYQTNNKEKK